MPQNEHSLEILDLKQDISPSRGSLDRDRRAPPFTMGMQKHQNNRSTQGRDQKLLLIRFGGVREKGRESKVRRLRIFFKASCQNYRQFASNHKRHSRKI